MTREDVVPIPPELEARLREVTRMLAESFMALMDTVLVSPNDESWLVACDTLVKRIAEARIAVSPAHLRRALEDHLLACQAFAGLRNPAMRELHAIAERLCDVTRQARPARIAPAIPELDAAVAEGKGFRVEMTPKGDIYAFIVRARQLHEELGALVQQAEATLHRE